MKKKHVYLGLIVILAAVFCYSAFSLIKIWAVYRENDKQNEEAIEEFLIYQTTSVATGTSAAPSGTTAFATETTDAAGSSNTALTEATAEPEPSVDYPNFGVNWDAMKAVNSEIVGWIWMHDTSINFPLLQSGDNTKYLKTTYNGSYSTLGSIFLDYRVNRDFTSRNTVIYGHNGNYNVKFGVLINLKKLSYYKTHPDFYILTEAGIKHYQIFSAYITDAYSDSYQIYFSGDDMYQQFLDKITAQSAVDTGIKPTASDLIVTLSTCTNNRSNKDERFVVHGRLVAE